MYVYMYSIYIYVCACSVAEIKDSTQYLVFQSVVIINTKIIQPTGGTATMLQWIILASDFTTINCF